MSKIVGVSLPKIYHFQAVDARKIQVNDLDFPALPFSRALALEIMTRTFYLRCEPAKIIDDDRTG